jgi:hypothetical protein
MPARRRQVTPAYDANLRFMLAHVILHLTLCGAIARANPEAAFPLHVCLVDRAAIVRFDRTLRIVRGDDNVKLVEFDSPPGIYRLDLDSPPYKCTGSEFVAYMPDVTRNMSMTLNDGPTTPPVPILFQGLAPTSFLYAKPTFVLIDKSVACGKPIGTLVPSNVTVENNDDAYYASMQVDQKSAPATIALQLQTPTHQHHYVRIPAFTYPPPAYPWPGDIHFDVTQDEIDDLATQPVDTLLCLRLWETKVARYSSTSAKVLSK